MSKVEKPLIALPRLRTFGDSLCLRDPRGRSSRPSLRSTTWRNQEALAIDGSFSILQRFVVTAQEGRAFVDASGDANPIHTEGDIVSGAMTAARLLLLPEMLVPRLAVVGLRCKFRAFSHYGIATTNRYTFRPTASGALDIELASFQNGKIVADGFIKTKLARTPTVQSAPGTGVAATTVSSWLQSLKLSPTAAFEAIGSGYPRAFLASLPSGEMVRQGGSGGLLNVLDLEFPEAGVPTLEPASLPTVHLEPSRPRNAFRRILTQVASGMVTYCSGYATVLLDMFRGDAATATAPPSASI